MVSAAAGAVGVGAAAAGGMPTGVGVGPRSPVSGVGVFHSTGVSVDCALGVLIPSKVIGAALGPQAEAITIQSTTTFATDLEYGGKRVLVNTDISRKRNALVLSLSLMEQLAAERRASREA